MKNFKLYLKDMGSGKIGADNPNINTANVHRKVLNYKIKNLRRGIYQPYRLRFRKNRVYSPKRYLNRISNKIKEEKMVFSFKSFLTESKESDKSVIATHMGKKLFSTHHAQDRDIERNTDREHVIHAFTKGVEHVKANGNKFGKVDHVLVTSKKHNRSVVFDIRPDKYSTNDKSSHFVHVTTFPPGEHYANKQTKKIMVEGVETEYILIEVE
jgi:hypothetical protein